VKRAVEAIAGGELDAAREVVRNALSVLDRAAQKGVVHPNNAGRRKSRLLLRYNAAVAARQAIAEEAPPKAKAALKAKATPKVSPKTAAKKAPAKRAKK